MEGLRINHFKVIKLSGGMAKTILGLESSAQDEVTFHKSHDEVQVVTSTSDGNGSFSETRVIVDYNVIAAFIKKKYNIGTTTSDRAEVSGDSKELIFRFLLDGTRTTDREPQALVADPGASVEAGPRKRVGRPKGTGKKLPLLPSNQHTGV